MDELPFQQIVYTFTSCSFYEELEEVFDQFPGYHMKILMRDFNAKVGREESLHEASNDNSFKKI
jgi:hypothetical protein